MPRSIGRNVGEGQGGIRAARYRDGGGSVRLKEPLIGNVAGPAGNTGEGDRSACADGLIRRRTHDGRNNRWSTGGEGGIGKTNCVKERAELRRVAVMEIPTIQRKRNGEARHIAEVRKTGNGLRKSVRHTSTYNRVAVADANQP